jgi:hypothetical protein
MTVSEIFSEFAAAFERGEDPYPPAYLERLRGRERFELEGMIERYLLTDAPLEPYDAEAFTAARETPALRRIAELAGEPSDAPWPALLPRLRADAGLRRRDLSARLCQTLGLAGHEDLVDAAYHDMERGAIDGRSVARDVLEALGDLLNTSVERLRRAGAIGPGGAPAPGGAFARGLPPGSGEVVPPPGGGESDAAARARVEELFYGRR